MLPWENDGCGAYILVPFDRPVKRYPDTTMFAFGKHRRLAPKIEKMMLDTPAKKLIVQSRLCLPLGEGDVVPSMLHIMLVAHDNGMIPIFSDRLPIGNEIKAVCDNLVDMPNPVPMRNGPNPIVVAAKNLWVRLLFSCQQSPQASLLEFSQGMTELVEKAGKENSMRVSHS